MQPLIHLFASIFSFIFILTSMLGAGLGLTTAEITAPLKRKDMVWRASIINFILVPAIALLISSIFKLIPSMHAGLLIIAMCAGAPFLPKMAHLAKGNQAQSITLMVLLMAITVGYLPAVLPLVVPGITIYPLRIALPQVFLLMLPLAIGLLVNARRPLTASLIKPFVNKTAAVSLLAAAAIGLWKDFHIFAAAYGTGIYIFIILLIGSAMFFGYLFGGANREDKILMSLGAGSRNITAALLVAVTNFPDRSVTTVVIIGSLVEVVILLVLAKLYSRKKYFPQ